MPEPSDVRVRGIGLTTLAVTLGALMPGLATTILAVANGDIAADLRTDLGQLQWITAAYLLGLAVALVPAGKLGDRFGRRLMFLVGIAGFGLTSLAIGLSSSVVLIVVLRVLQGVFGGFLTTNAVSLLRANVTQDRLPTALGIFNSVQGLSIAAGPVVGGLLVQGFGWRATMFVNVPIAIICLVVGSALLREVRLEATGRFDTAGTIALVVSLSALVYALINAPADGWTAPSTLALGAVAAVGLVAFGLIERRVADPIVPLWLFRDHSFTGGSILSVLAFFALNGTLFLVALFWLQVQRIPPTDVGLRVLPLGLCLLVSAILSGPIIRRLGDRWALIIGSLFLAGGTIAMAFPRLDGGYPAMGVGLGVVGLGLGLLVTATVNATVGNAPVEAAGPAAGVQQTASRLGATLGVAVLGGIMSVATAGAFSEELARSSLPPGLQDALRDAGGTAVAGGIAPIPEGSTTAIADEITMLAGSAFIHGMTTTLIICAAICLVGAAVSMLVRGSRGDRREAEDPVARTTHVGSAA